MSRIQTANEQVLSVLNSVSRSSVAISSGRSMVILIRKPFNNTWEPFFWLMTYVSNFSLLLRKGRYQIEILNTLRNSVQKLTYLMGASIQEQLHNILKLKIKHKGPIIRILQNTTIQHISILIRNIQKQKRITVEIKEKVHF